jgi:hypothetical protein
VKPGQWVELRFALPEELDLSQQPLRLDPTDRPLRVHIATLRLRTAETEALLFSAETPEGLAALTLQGDAQPLTTEPELLLDSLGTDPQLLLPRLDSATSTAPAARPGWLEVRMMIEPQAEAEPEASQPAATAPTVQRPDRA